MQQAANRVSQCGLGPVTTRYDAELDEGVLVTTTARSVTDEQLACADKAASYYTLQLSPSIQPRYDAIREARFSREVQAQAREWLSVHNLLNKAPAYREGITDDAAFTRQLENLCGPRAKGAFQSKFGFHALSPAWVKREMHQPDFGGDVFACLLNVTTVAGFKVGFIGNEYYRR